MFRVIAKRRLTDAAVNAINPTAVAIVGRFHPGIQGGRTTARNVTRNTPKSSGIVVMTLIRSSAEVDE
jgi:hypothetical protein